MSQLTRGPLPASVYWRRRIAALLAAVTVVSLVAGGIGLVTDGGEQSQGRVALSGAGATSPAPTTTVTVDASSARKKAERRRKGGQPKAPSLPEPQGSCADEDVVARPEVGRAIAGRPVTIKLTLTTVLAEACTWELSRDSFTWKITSGSDEIWTSRECPHAVPTEEIVVRRDSRTTTTLTWGGKRSDADCSRLTAWATSGYYHVTVAPFAGEPREVQFELEAPVGAVITAAPKPKRR